MHLHPDLSSRTGVCLSLRWVAAATATAVVAVLGAAQPLTAVTLPMPCCVVAWGDNFFGQTDVPPGLVG